MNLVCIERAAEVIDLQEIDAPTGIKIHDAVVISLTSCIVANQEIVLQPSAGRRCAVINLVPRCLLATFQLIGTAHNALGHSSHDVDAKLQTHPMNLVCQCLETFVLAIDHTRREARRRRQVASVLVEDIVLRSVLVVVASAQRRMVAIPADVNDNILPAVLDQIVVNQILCVLQDFLLRNGGVIAVPRIPAHWRCHCPSTKRSYIFVGLGLHCSYCEQRCEKNLC